MEHKLLWPSSHMLLTYIGHEVVSISTARFKKCGVVVRSGGQERYIVESNPVMLYLKYTLNMFPYINVCVILQNLSILSLRCV